MDILVTGGAGFIGSKVAAERYVELWREQSGGECVVLRLTNVYGPRQKAQGEAGVVSIFTERALDRRPCIVNADGEQTRDLCSSVTL